MRCLERHREYRIAVDIAHRGALGKQPRRARPFGPASTVLHDEVGEHKNDGRTYGAVMRLGGASAVRIITDRPLTRLRVLAHPVSGVSTTFANIAGHRDVNATECPGGVFYAKLPTVRSDVAAMISGAPSPSPTAAPSPRPTAAPSPTPTARPSPTPRPSPSPTPSDGGGGGGNH